VHHKLLLKYVRKRICDQRFLALLWQVIKAAFFTHRFCVSFSTFNNNNKIICVTTVTNGGTPLPVTTIPKDKFKNFAAKLVNELSSHYSENKIEPELAFTTGDQSLKYNTV
jgi:hypothetical protein